jgi:hypothetical protein
MLDTWEVETGRIAVQGYPGKKFRKTTSQPIEADMVACAFHPTSKKSMNRKIEVQVGQV